MRTPEEVAREYYPECLQVTEPEGSKFAGERFCRSHRVKWVGDLDMCPVQHVLWLAIRERDAEVRADERAKVLAGFTEEYADRMVARRVPCDCPGDWQHHGGFVGDDGPQMHVSFEAVPSRRLVSPWEPTP